MARAGEAVSRDERAKLVGSMNRSPPGEQSARNSSLASRLLLVAGTLYIVDVVLPWKAALYRWRMRLHLGMGGHRGPQPASCDHPGGGEALWLAGAEINAPRALVSAGLAAAIVLFTILKIVVDWNGPPLRLDRSPSRPGDRVWRLDALAGTPSGHGRSRGGDGDTVMSGACLDPGVPFGPEALPVLRRGDPGRSDQVLPGSMLGEDLPAPPLGVQAAPGGRGAPVHPLGLAAPARLRPIFFGIWDRQGGRGPVSRYPRTDDGWRAAWLSFSAWEPQSAEVHQAAPPPDP